MGRASRLKKLRGEARRHIEREERKLQDQAIPIQEGLLCCVCLKELIPWHGVIKVRMPGVFERVGAHVKCATDSHKSLEILAMSIRRDETVPIPDDFEDIALREYRDAQLLFARKKLKPLAPLDLTYLRASVKAVRDGKEALPLPPTDEEKKAKREAELAKKIADEDLAKALAKTQDHIFANTLAPEGSGQKYVCEECHRLWAKSETLCGEHKHRDRAKEREDKKKEAASS